MELLASALVTEPPVDVAEVAMRCGSRVVGWDTAEEAISGLLVELEYGPVITYMAGHPSGWTRSDFFHLSSACRYSRGKDRLAAGSADLHSPVHGCVIRADEVIVALL